MESLRKCLRLFFDLECYADPHSEIEVGIGEARWFEPMLIKPEPHLPQQSAEIIGGSDPHFRNVHKILLRSSLPADRAALIDALSAE
jgi:hypothetical protein